MYNRLYLPFCLLYAAHLVDFISPFRSTRPNSLVYDNFTINVESGKILALVGPSGGMSFFSMKTLL
jgi:ABC-type transporter Mla maintaining outer membrane lipid asymmetry ATPase subunit MlaF